MTEYHWYATRDKANEAFNDSIGPLEEEVRLEFERHPARVTRLLDEIAERVMQGKVRSGWAVVIKRLRDDRDRPDAVTDAGDERGKQVRLVEAWMRTAGLHFDRWSEVEQELFGELGRLHPYRDELVLREHMHQLWEKLRPRGSRLEFAEIQRAHTWKKVHLPLRKTKLRAKRGT